MDGLLDGKAYLMQVDSDEKGGIASGLLPKGLDSILKGGQPFRRR